MSPNYTFNISLSVLNHLGRNLYRNIITIIGEAISNSWDADANNVWISIDRNKKCMKIIDDGLGMDDYDFQEKFLKIGYTKRKNGLLFSEKGRPFIGRKGIGKLALLSCAKRIHILTKKESSDFVGGVIDNNSLDEAITDDLSSQDYFLEIYSKNLENELMSKAKRGTYIYFENLNEDIYNTIDYLKSAIARYFKFALIDPSFAIYVNEEKISNNFLSRFANNTQFLWKINNFQVKSNKWCKFPLAHVRQ